MVVQTTYNIESISGATSHGRCKKLFLPVRRESENGSAVMPSSRLDFLKALVKRGPTGSTSIASRKADRVNAHQVRTKTTH